MNAAFAFLGPRMLSAGVGLIYHSKAVWSRSSNEECYFLSTHEISKCPVSLAAFALWANLAALVDGVVFIAF